MKLSETEWRERLTEDQFRVTRLKGTEYPFTGELLHHTAAGTYHCVCCNTELFNGNTKFDAGCGWPSFYQSLEGKVRYVEDNSHGMQRIEIVCNNCDAHLGHIFEDGPAPTGQRYCVNSASLTFTHKT